MGWPDAKRRPPSDRLLGSETVGVVSARRSEGRQKAFGRRVACGRPSVEFSTGGWSHRIWGLKVAEKAFGRRPGCNFAPMRVSGSAARLGQTASRPTSRNLEEVLRLR
jgi:hypothetical protein